MPEERKLASILFADIVGSTPLGASEDPELVRRTLARVFGEMRQLLSAHGGTVEKFIGDAVMAVFGVPVAHDDDAERAVRAGFALRDRIAALAPTMPFPVTLRIGINSGQIVTGGAEVDTLVTGAPVNAAARIQQNAAPGEIVVGALTRSLTGGTVRYGDARTVDAKGMGPLEVCPALGLQSTVPEGRRGLGLLRAPLIGRDAELRLLKESHRKTGDEGSAYLVTVYGQAGVGKSRLVEEFAEVIGRERVLRGRCLPYGVGITYWPLQEMLRADAEIVSEDSREAATEKLRRYVLAAFGAGSGDAEAVARGLTLIAGLERPEDALPKTTGADLGRDLRWAIRRYFEARAHDKQLTLIFDDIHWAEAPMLEAIEHLAEWSRAPLFIICLARPELRDRRSSWGGGLMNAAAVRLEPLSADETGRLIGALLSINDLPRALQQTISDRTQGNPLYVEEMLRMLIDAGDLDQRGGRWSATRNLDKLAVPASLQGLLEARLDQLPAEVKGVLQRASVIGRVFYPEALAALGPIKGGVDDLIAAAARRDFVVERDERGLDGRWAWQFKHILVRDVAYESTAKEERSRLHDAFGRWLESVAGERAKEYAEIVAYHADRAYALATELRSPRADALGERALDLVLAAARRAHRLDERPAHYRLYARARDIAQAIGAPLSTRVEAASFAALNHVSTEGEAAARQELDDALALARAAGPSEGLVELLAYRLGHEMPGANADRIEKELLAAAGSTGNHDLVVMAMLTRTWPYWYAGELARCRSMLAEVREYATAHDARRHWTYLTMRESDAANALGDFDTFTRSELERSAAAQAGESKIMRTLGPLQTRYRLAMAAGDAESAVAAMREWVALVPELGLPGVVAPAWLGAALLELGQYEEAIHYMEQSLTRAEARGASGGVQGERRQLLARAQLRAGRLEEAVASAERAYAEIGDDDPFSRSSSAVALAMVRDAQGETAEADDLFRKAIDAANGYRNLATLAQIEYGRFLIPHLRSAEARAQLEPARDFYAHPFVAKRREEVEELLRRCDVHATP